MSRYAPTLSEDVKRRHMTESGKECRVGDCGRCHRGAAELRALLAVVRAAQRTAEYVGVWCATPCPHEHPACVEHERLDRALARLRKVSGRKP